MQFRTDNTANSLRRKVVLSNVDAVEFRRQTQVRTVVHDQLCSGSYRPLQFCRLLQDEPGVAGLVSVLKQGGTRRDQVLGKTDKRTGIGEAGGVRNWIETRKHDVRGCQSGFLALYISAVYRKTFPLPRNV